ncbi:MAG: GDP-mannose 4,6-dehydratase [Planctomycetota bacterium]|nr:GDP-mannose 4,6-dehydratase [Planctomycetota bacterium]
MATIQWNKLHSGDFSGVGALVTGGAGFIGSHLTEALLSLGATVVVLDDLSGGDFANLEPFGAKAGKRLESVKGSILDKATVERCAKGCRWIFHQAALGSVPRSVEQPELYTQVNVIGTLNVLEAARDGDSIVLPKVETMPVQPRSPYAASKVAGEALIRAYAVSYGLDTAALRYFNIFGPRQNANSAYAAVIAAFAKALIAGKRPVIYGDGEQSRDFTFVANVVHANLLAARSAKPVGGEVFNVAAGSRISVTALAGMMAPMLGRPDLKPVYEPERAGDVKHSAADLGLAQSLVGYKPIVDFPTGLAPTVEWYRQVIKPGA